MSNFDQNCHGTTAVLLKAVLTENKTPMKEASTDSIVTKMVITAAIGYLAAGPRSVSDLCFW